MEENTTTLTNIIQIFHCFEGNIPECLSWGSRKSLRCFIPRFPGISEMLYFPTPQAEGNITSQGFLGTEGQTLWYISREAMKYLLFYILLVKTLEELIWSCRGNVTPADPWYLMSNVACTVKCPSLVQSGVLSIPKAGNIMFAVPAVSKQYTVTQYLARLCICEVRTVQNILCGFL